MISDSDEIPHTSLTLCHLLFTSFLPSKPSAHLALNYTAALQFFHRVKRDLHKHVCVCMWAGMCIHVSHMFLQMYKSVYSTQFILHMCFAVVLCH